MPDTAESVADMDELECLTSAGWISDELSPSYEMDTVAEPPAGTP